MLSDHKSKLFAEFYTHFEKGQPKYCWKWLGPWNTDNAPIYYIGRRPELAQRWIYFFFNGRKLTRGQLLRSKCGNDQCVNPLHMARFDTTLLRALTEPVEHTYVMSYWNCLTDDEKEYNKNLLNELHMSYANEWPYILRLISIHRNYM